MDSPSLDPSLRAELMPVAVGAEERAEDALVKIAEFDKIRAFLPDRARESDQALALWQGQYQARRDRADAIWERIGTLTDDERAAQMTDRVARWTRELEAADAAQPRLDEMSSHPEIWATSIEEVGFDRAIAHDGASAMSPGQLRINAAQNRARRQAVAEYLASLTDSDSPIDLHK